jgi:hypothetical protein
LTLTTTCPPFTAVFLLQVMAAVGVKELRLD